ncbi:MAG TPA: HAD hydrolase family protein, partial [Candidatus Binataceae bacterium]|nr:HAD hydrolase family protein [Candidatus Binataceae bacterium]
LPSIAEILPTGYEVASFFICSDGAISFAGAKDNYSVLDRAVLRQPTQVSQWFSDIDPFDTSLFVFYDDRANLEVDVSLAWLHSRFLSQILQGRTYVKLAREDVGSRGLGALSVGILGPKEKCELAAEQLKVIAQNKNVAEDFRVRVFEEIRIADDLWWCEVSALDADKGVALAKLLDCGRYSSSAPLIVLGDGSNDVGMAMLADVALCPPWASEALSAVATVVANVRSCRQFVMAISEKIANWKEGE